MPLKHDEGPRDTIYLDDHGNVVKCEIEIIADEAVDAQGATGAFWTVKKRFK